MPPCRNGPPGCPVGTRRRGTAMDRHANTTPPQSGRMPYMARTVLVVDDSGSYRATACAVLAARGFEIAGEAADGAEALTAVQRLRPDAVLLDVNLPDMLGTAVARELQAGSNGAPDVVLISTED